MTQILERVRFRTLPGTDEAQFIAAAAAISDWAKTQPGFAYRTLVRDGEEWIDLAFWSDLDAAKAASAGFMEANGSSAFMAMIDPESVRMEYLSQMHSAMAA
ncbi:MAG: hypothetical protein WBB85_17405 [Albidovulum sp.]|uniref:hypothetical protein n=1 Tax=Albidovulum sp. TaxID=1872424 RepID=UPI003CC44CB3